MLINVSDRLAGRIHAAMSGKEDACYRATLILQNPDTEYKKKVTLVTGIQIVQDFIHNYMDQILVSITMTPNEYREMYSNATGLEATLTLDPCNAATRAENLEQDPIVFKCRVITDQLQDIDKVLPANLTVREEDAETRDPHQKDMLTTIDLHLIELECYDLRHVQMNSIFTECDIESVIHWAAANFGAETCVVIPPDNKQTYNNLVVPPMQDISSMYPFLQQRYGIYSKGLGYYFTEKTMYVYPAYDHELSTSTSQATCNIVGVPQSLFRGNGVYHNRVEDDIWLIALDAKLSNISQRSYENLGNVSVSLNPETALDNAAKLGGDGKLTRDNKDVTTVQSQNTAPNANAKMTNIKYETGRSNVYVATSRMAQGDAVLLNAMWDMAVPKSIKPGMNCQYHYDAAGGEFKTQPGRIMMVQYKAFPRKNTGDDDNPVLRFVANITAHLAPDQKSDAQSQFVD